MPVGSWADPRREQTLHIRPGQDIAAALGASGVPGVPVSWADPLCEGPLRRWRTAVDRRRDRAVHLSLRHFLSYGEVMRNLGTQDTVLEDAAHFGEIVLWFEHDLFDQSILVYLLGRLAAEVAAGKVSLVTLDRHPAVKRFIGLGQLGPADLAGLYPGRVPVGAAHLRLARQAWLGLTAASPARLVRFALADHAPLPYLGAALRRYLAEYPSVVNGLSRTEQRALETLAGGAGTAAEAFRMVQAQEPAPWQGDTMFFAVLRGLASGPAPLLRRAAGEGPPLAKTRSSALAGTALAVTPAGEAVLAGRQDWFELDGSSRWLGGVYLEGPDPAWRYDPVRQSLVSCR